MSWQKVAEVRVKRIAELEAALASSRRAMKKLIHEYTERQRERDSALETLNEIAQALGSEPRDPDELVGYAAEIRQSLTDAINDYQQAREDTRRLAEPLKQLLEFAAWESEGGSLSLPDGSVECTACGAQGDNYDAIDHDRPVCFGLVLHLARAAIDAITPKPKGS